jgi:hypothetical protein
LDRFELRREEGSIYESKAEGGIDDTQQLEEGDKKVKMNDEG